MVEQFGCGIALVNVPLDSSLHEVDRLGTESLKVRLVEVELLLDNHLLYLSLVDARERVPTRE